MALILRGSIWHVRAMVGGVTIAKSTKTSNRKVAEQLEKKWVSELHSEVVVAGRKPTTVAKAIEQFLQSRRGTKGYSSAEVKMKAWACFGDRMLHELTAHEVEEQARKLVDEGYAVNTINVSLIYWNALQNFAHRIGITTGHKVKRLKGGTKRLRFLSEEEVQQLTEALNPKHYREKRKAQDNLDFFQLLLHTGARENEIATMQLTQIDQDEGTLTIHRSKGGTDTTMPMSKVVTEIVARRMVADEQPLKPGQTLHGRAHGGFLFPERAKGRYNNEFLVKACVKIGLKDVNLHTLRHTFATRMLKAKLDITEVQYLLGHKNLSSTMVYTHVVPNTAGHAAKRVLDAI